MIASGLTYLIQHFELLFWRFSLFFLCRNCKWLVRTGCALMMLTGQGMQ